MSRLILASTSRYRAQLLERLGLPFDTRSPGVEEAIPAGEPPMAAACRLARAKAQSIDAPDALVIGSDQVASLDGTLLRKPGDHATALEQLWACRGRSVTFHTAVAVVHPSSGRLAEAVDETVVTFRMLDRETLDRYLRRERPYDCAGGFKAEGLGITLFETIRSTDPTALIGLPLISLTTLLTEAGLPPLSRHSA